MKMVKCKKCGKVFPMNMSNCPECFTKRSLPVGAVVAITICCLVIAICFGAIIGTISSEETTSGTNSYQQEAENKTEIQYIEVSADDIFSAFEENEIAAEAKYKGKAVKITGIVSEINSKSTLISANILFKVEGSMFGCVQCNFNSENSKALATVEKGQTITIVGTCGELSFYNLMVNACKLQ
jgi:hypothetical protein